MRGHRRLSIKDFTRVAENLRTLHRDIRRCRVCIEQPLRVALPHEPRPVAVLSPTARIAVCGQAPGIRVHKSGVPFTDPSGDRLREWMGVSSEVFYDAARIAIVPMGFCFPGYDKNGGDLPPRRECRQTWHDRVFAAMPQLELKLVIGGAAFSYHLGKEAAKSVTNTVVDWERYFNGEHLSDGETEQSACRVIPLPHPSWRNNASLKKNPWFEKDLLPVLRKTIQAMV